MNLISVVLLGSGGVLIYSAVKGFDPRDVVKYALGGPAPVALQDTPADPSQFSDPGTFPFAPKDQNDPKNKNKVPNKKYGDGGEWDDSGAGPAFNPTTDMPDNGSVGV